MSLLQDFGEVKRKRVLLFPHFFKRMLKEAASYGMFGVGGFFGAITAFFLYASLASYTSPLPIPVASKPAYLGVSDVRLDELRSAVRALEGQVAALKPSEHVVLTDLSLATGNNLIRNSSFETAEGGKPRQWTYTLDATSSNTRQTEEAIRTGDYGLKFKGKGAGNGKEYGISQPETQTVAGRTYTFSAYVKHTNLNVPATLRIGFWDKDNNRYAIMKEIPVRGTQDWYRVATTVMTTGHPSDAANWYPMLEVRKLPAGGAVYLDDVQLEEGSLLTVYSSAQAAAGSSGSANALGDGSILSSVYGDLYPAQSGVGSLGTTTNRWHSLHLSGADIDQDGNLSAAGSISSRKDISASGAMTANGNLIVHGTATFNSPIGINGLTTFTEGINVGSATITNFAGEGLTVSSGALSVNLAVGSGFTFASGKLSLLRNCASNEVLAWDGTQWACASISSVGGITKTGSPVAGYLTYWSGASAITGNSALYYDGTNLGIGKTNPGFSLDVNGIINATALYVNGSPYIGSQWTTSGSSIYYTSGNVGIGTTSPSTKLHILGDMRVTGAFYDSSNSAGSSGLMLTSTGTGTTWSSLATLGIVSGTGSDNYLARFNSAGTGVENGTLVDNATSGISLNIDSLNNVGIGGTAASTIPRLYVGANGNVGIGTTNPGQALDVTGSIKASTSLISPIWKPATDSTTALRVTKADGTTAIGNWDTTNRRLGINVTAPVRALEVDSGSTALTAIRLNNQGGGYEITFDSSWMRFVNSLNGANPLSLGFNGDLAFGGVIGVTKNTVPYVIKSEGYAITGGGALLWALSQDNNNGTWDIFRAENSAPGDTVKFRVTNPGLVAVGNHTPTAWLDLKASTTARASLRVRSGGAPTSPNAGDIWYDGTNLKFYSSGTTSLAGTDLANTFTTNQTINGNLYTLGNVGIGTTSPSTQLHTTGGVRFANFAAGTLQTDANGNLSVSSDARLKTVQQPFGSSLDKLVKLSGVVYKWNELSGLDTTHDYVGFLAQDVEAQFPGLVGTSSNGYKSLNYAGLTVPIIEAMKEQQGQIEALKLAGTINNAIPVVTTSLQINIASVSAQLAEDDDFISLLVERIQKFIFDTEAVFSESVTFLKDVTFGGRIFFQDKDMGGFAVISKGTDQVTVKFTDPYKTEPVINITSKDHPVTGFITNASSTGFTIKITQNAEKDLLFNWTAIAVSDPTTTQDESAHILSPIVETIPTITPSPTFGSNQPSPSSAQLQPVIATPSPTTTPSQSPVASPSAALQ